jgi:hypothetical protein
MCSQDWGVGAVDPASTNSSDYFNNGLCEAKPGKGIFGPGFPASCPWVTTVGGTMIGGNKTIHGAEEGTNVYEYYRDNGTLTAYQQWATGGGFSVTFDAPPYQQDALAQYFKEHDPELPYFHGRDILNTTGLYNRNGRGIPDLSASRFLLPHAVATALTIARSLCGHPTTWSLVFWCQRRQWN